jgi:predicted RNA-binding protein with PUA-like domain
MTQAWLLKTEPSTYSFADLQRDRRTVWDGITNALALRNLARVKKGDRLLIYHTGNERAVVGRARALRGAYADPRAADPKRLVIEVGDGPALARPVTLSEIKALPIFAGWELLRLPRLSVIPVSQAQLAEIERLSRS